ncbi:MAG: hypothetical protein SGARI_002767, partial [Bacillariaceae sp.]
MKSKFNVNHSGDGLDDNCEKLAERGMAFIHKFRAKRKALLQAKFMEQSGEQHSPEIVAPPIHSPAVPEQVEVNKSPQQLEPYMMQDGPSSQKTSPASSIEEQREKLRRLKEKRRKSHSSQSSRGEDSRRSLLQGDSSPVEEVPEKGSVCSDSVSSKGVNSLSKASPFRHIKFQRQKKDAIYEVLSPESSVPPSAAKDKSAAEAGGSDDDSPLLQGHSPSSSDLTSSSSPGTLQKNSSFTTAGALKSDDINKIIIDPQSPECLSPIQVYRTSDHSDTSGGFSHLFSAHGSVGSFSETNRNIFDMSDISSRIPTIFEDNSSTAHDRVESSNNTSMWSDMSFPTDPPKFPAQDKSTTAGLSTNAIAERIGEVSLTENAESSSSYNDSFDAIVSRETPSQKIFIDVTDDSPTGVLDSMFQMEKQDSGKSELLSLLDDDDDHLFTDKEDSFAAPTGSPLSTPV